MARFYARFDSGSQTDLDNDYFDKRRVYLGSASAALLRDGLIASRSAVSSDVYDDLDGENQSGGKGTIFPADTSTLPTPTLLSWSNAYTSSFEGIKTPTTNVYGSGVINYSSRPTQSVLSTNPIIGAATPADPIQLNYDVYLSASNAVSTVLGTIQNGAGTEQTPFSRTGNSPSRTLHSIWCDPNLQYFAWDDLTPGTPQNVSLFRSSSTNFYWTNNFQYRLDWGPTYEYRNDEQATPRIALWFYSSSLDEGSANQTLTKTSLSPGATSYTWTINVGTANIATDGEYEVLYELNFRDNKVIAEGGTTIGDGPVVTAVAGQMTLYRLYGPFTVKRFNGTGNEAVCLDYNGTDTTVYADRDWDIDPVASGDRVYINTNIDNPSGLTVTPDGRYRITSAGASQDDTFEMVSDGLIETVGSCS